VRVKEELTGDVRKLGPGRGQGLAQLNQSQGRAGRSRFARQRLGSLKRGRAMTWLETSRACRAARQS
jgi:hypothetical protein